MQRVEIEKETREDYKQLNMSRILMKCSTNQ